MDVLRTLLKLPQRFAGSGLNHAGERFAGALTLQPLVNQTALILHYTATLADGRRVHTEATLLGKNIEGKLCLWPVMEELPFVLPHAVISALPQGAGAFEVTFASGPREAMGEFREEITIALRPGGSLTYAHSWGLPNGIFEERSSCEMLPSET